jgi:hypothetical protein
VGYRAFEITSAKILTHDQESLIMRTFRLNHFPNDYSTDSYSNFLVDYYLPEFLLFLFMNEFGFDKEGALNRIRIQDEKITLKYKRLVLENDDEAADPDYDPNDESDFDWHEKEELYMNEEKLDDDDEF